MTETTNGRDGSINGRKPGETHIPCPAYDLCSSKRDNCSIEAYRAGCERLRTPSTAEQAAQIGVNRIGLLNLGLYRDRTSTTC